MWGKIMGPIFSKLWEKLVDYVQDTVTTMKDYKLTLEILERNLRSLSAKASDIEEEVKNAELSGKKKRKREVENWLIEVQMVENEFTELVVDMEAEGFISNFCGENRTQKLSGRVEGLIEQSRHFGEILLGVCEPREEPLLLTKRLVGVEFEENLDRIWKFLTIDGLSSVGIYGMGGTGKTFLAKYIHNRFLEETQQLVIWVTISQTFNIKALQHEIARLLNLDLSKEPNEDQRAGMLNQALSGQNNFVLIFDDVVNYIDLEKIGDPISLEGCRMIITTRSLEVCNRIGCQQVVQVKTLNESEAWILFKETLGERTALTSQVQKLAKCMVEKCGGLPLAIVTAAGSMKGKCDIHEWRNGLTELNESIIRECGNEEMVFEILKYSFDRLDQGSKKSNGFTMLQHCFLYCCLYPEDQTIRRTELIKRFISEGLLDKKRSRRKQMDQGHVILNKLVSVCLLESDETWWVKMHDVVRVMALNITKGKYMRIERLSCSLKEVLNEEEHQTNELEKISLVRSGIQDFAVRSGIQDFAVGWSPNCPKLSTLLLQGNYSLKFIPDSFFSNMHGLQVLDLSETQIEVLPDSLSNLRSLISLLVGKCRSLQHVPNLRNLKELREVDLSNTSIKEVPQGMDKLVNLECLKIDADQLKSVPNNFLINFSKLQCLHLPAHIEAPVEEIERLEQLDEFHGRVKDACDFKRLMGCQPSFKEHTRSYRVMVTEQYDMMSWIPEGDTRVLIMCGTNLKNVWRRDVSALESCIQLLRLRKCMGLRSCLVVDLQHLNFNLKYLRRIYIDGCNGVECILSQDQLFITGRESKCAFHNLEVMDLRNLPDFMGVMIFERSAGVNIASFPSVRPVFPSLKTLIIRECNKIKKLGLPLWKLHNLEEIHVQDCHEMEEIILEALGDGHGEGNQSQSQSPLVHLPKLQWLSLIRLPRLKCISNATLVCTSIRYINIKGCTQVKKLPLVFGQPNHDSPPYTLERIQILESEKGWWASLELEHPSLHPLLQPFLEVW